MHIEHSGSSSTDEEDVPMESDARRAASTSTANC